MGNSIAHSQNPVLGDFHTFLLEFPTLAPHGDLMTSTKLVKAAQCHLEKEGLVFTKLYIKREPTVDFDLSHLKAVCDGLQSKLSKSLHPNLVAGRFFETKVTPTQKAAFLVRQYFQSSLFQKFHKHPFPTEIEKLWFAYQLLEAVRQMHAEGVCHGDIKSENVLVTSWGWVLLADFSGFYKPTYLEEANLTSFKFFFTTTKRERCYLAPERFYSGESGTKEGLLDPAMDVFSLGCVLAEIFFDGEALFTYSKLMSYRRGEFDLAQELGQIKVANVPELIQHMLQLSPTSRYSIDRYCELWQEKVFPGCFSSVLHPMLRAVVSLETLSTPDSRVLLVKKNAEVIWTQVLGTRAVPDYDTGGTELVDYAPTDKSPCKEAILIAIDFLCCNLRNVLKPSNKLLSVAMIVSYLSDISDDMKLHRVLPFFVSLLMDKEERSKVKIAALRAVQTLLMQVRKLSSNDLLIFDEYIWPSVSTLRHDESAVVQAAFADHLSDFAEIGRIFLELERHIKKSHSSPTDSFDSQLEEVKKSIMMTFKDLYTRDNVMVHKALTKKLGELCAFFGKKLTNNHILPLIIPWLSRVWDRRILILEQIPSVVKVIGYSALTGYIYPCMEDGLKEREEYIVYATLKAFRFIDLPVTPGELQIYAKAAHLLLHPNQWIKDEMLQLIRKVIEKLDPAENYLRLRPLLLPFLTLPAECVFSITPEVVQTHIVKSFRRKIFENLGEKPEKLLGYEEAFYDLVAENSRKSIASEEMMRSVFRVEKPEILKLYSLGDGNELEIALSKVAPTQEKPPEAKAPSTGKLVEAASAKSIYDSPFEGFSPKGRLVCCLNEHESAVTSLAVSEDSSLFLSASKDSTVRIWTMKNLQKYPLHSYMTLKSSDIVKVATGARLARLRKVVLLESDNAFAVSADTIPPSIFLYKVRNRQTAVAKAPVHTLKPSEESAIMGMCALPEDGPLAYVTQSGVLHIYDCREQRDALRYEFGCHRGLPLCLSAGVEGKSMVIGTTAGGVLLYDLRFNIVSRCFRYSKQTPVLNLLSFSPDRRCCFSPALQQSSISDPFAILATGGSHLEVPILNLHTGRCSVLFTVNNPTPTIPYLLNEDGSIPTAIPKPPLFQQFMGEVRLPSNEVYQKHLLERIGEVSRKNKELMQSVTSATQRIRTVFDGRATVRSLLCPSFHNTSVPYILTAGSEALIRYWDLQTPKNSHRVAPGLVSHRVNYTLHAMPDVTIVEEMDAEEQLPGPEAGPMRSDFGEFTPEWKVKHLDDILDMALGNGSNGGVLITAGRDGSIRLWN